MYEIYTDGATSNNGYTNAVGGWAYIILKDGKIIQKESGQEKDPIFATNQRMELTAALKACEKIEEMDGFATVKLYSDSAYLINCFKQNWWKGWQANGWKNSKKQPVANQDLWEKMIHFFMKAPGYDFVKVRGHSNNILNNIVDAMAVEAKMGVIEHDVYVDNGKTWINVETLVFDNNIHIPIDAKVKTRTEKIKDDFKKISRSFDNGKSSNF